MLCLLTFLTIYIIPSYHWVELPSPGLRAYEHTVVYDPAGDLFFIMGGDSTGSYTNMDICLEFDPKTNTWDTKASMFSQKRGHSASYRKGFIHVVCGTHNYDNRISEHEVYNIQSDSWSLAADAPIPVRNPSLVTWRDSILYIMGGYDSTHTARTEVYYYTPSTNSWDSATSLPRPLHGGGAKIKGDTIFIIGGADGMTAYSDILFGEINPADPSSINWQWGEPLPLPSNQYNNGLAIKNNKAYMVGGLYNDGTNQVWEYDIPGEIWTQLPDYPASIIIRGEFAATRDLEDSLGGGIYCFMGDTSYFYSRKPTDECYKLEVVLNDAGIYSINSPVSSKGVDSFAQVSGTVKNYGINTISFKTYAKIYDPDSQIVFFDSVQIQDLFSSDTLKIDFGSFQLTKAGTYTVEMFTYSLEDTYRENDSLSTTFTVSDVYWANVPSSGIKAYGHTAVYDPVGDLFFIMGGDSTGSSANMDICLEFDPKVNTWDTKAPMFTAKRAHSASFRKGFIHVLCGIGNHGNKLVQHEVYDIQANSWDLAAPAPIPVTGPSVVTWRDSLVYIIGGYDVYHDARTEVYYYTPSTNSWDSATSLPRPLHGGGAKIKGDTIFIIGGADGASAFSNILLGEIDPSDPSSINWQWGEPLPLPSNQYSNGLAIKNNKACMVGGLYNDGTNQVWEYDIPGETWTQLPDYPTSIIIRGEFAATRDLEDSLGGGIYCFMGDTTDFYYKTPTDECYKLLGLSSGIEEKKNPESNSISLKSTIYLSNDIKIDFNIVENCDLKVRMYDVLGREVFSLLEKNVVIGHHQLDIRENFENGIYFIKIEAGDTVEKAKVILIR